MSCAHSYRCRCIPREQVIAEQLARGNARYRHPWDLVHVLSHSSEPDAVFAQALELVSGYDRLGNRTERFQACSRLTSDREQPGSVASVLSCGEPGCMACGGTGP